MGKTPLVYTKSLEKEDLPDEDFVLGVGIIDPITGKSAVRPDMNTEFVEILQCWQRRNKDCCL